MSRNKHDLAVLPPRSNARPAGGHECASTPTDGAHHGPETLLAAGLATLIPTVTDPLGYTSKPTGLHTDTGGVMEVVLNKGKDGLGAFPAHRVDADGQKATVQARLPSQNSASPGGNAGAAIANDLTAREDGCPYCWS